MVYQTKIRLGNYGLLVLTSVFIILTGCRNNLDEVEAVTQSAQAFPTEIATEMTVIYTDSGKVQLKLYAPEMKHFTLNVKEAYTEMPKGVAVVIYNDSGAVKTRMRANYAIKYELSKLMEAKYKVEVTNVSGEKLETEQLIWDEKNRKIRSNAFVKITTGKEILMGEGLEANEEFTEYEILKPSGSVSLPDDKEEKK